MTPLCLVYNKTGNSKRLTDMDIEPLDCLCNGKPFFRKLFYNWRFDNERDVYKLLSVNPNDNIVNIYKIADTFVDLELLDIEYTLTVDIINTMNNVKNILHNMGIVYLDWREDNIGVSHDGNPKLFDFNSAGIVDCDGNWIKAPPTHYHYTNALKMGLSDPYIVDNYIFWKNMERSEYIKK